MRLIDADDLIPKIESYRFDTVDQGARRTEHIVKAHICDLINSQPAIQIVDAKRKRAKTERLDRIRR